MLKPHGLFLAGLLGSISLGLVSAPSSLARRGDIQALDRASFGIQGPNGREVFELTFRDLTGVLRKFQPAEARISNVTVVDDGPRRTPRISFVVKKNALFKTFVVQVHADVRRQDITCPGPANGSGARILMDVDQSDSTMSDNVTTLFFDLCLTETPGGSLTVTGTSAIVEGPNRSTIVGSAVIDSLKQQTTPMMEAFAQRAAEIAQSLVKN